MDAKMWGLGSQLESEPWRVEFQRGPLAGEVGALTPSVTRSLWIRLPSPPYSRMEVGVAGWPG